MNPVSDRHAVTAPVLRVMTACVLGAALLVAPTVRADEGERSTALTDANIAAIVLAANRIDIRNGELAIGKSQNPKVREFAKLMIDDHTSVNAKAAELAGRLKLVPEENEASRSLVAATDSTRKALSRKSGRSFDRAYVDNEVAYHQAVIDLLKGTIVPSVQNDELRKLLVGVMPAFVAHLEHAKQIQASLVK